MKRSKKYQEALKKIDRSKKYTIEEAIKLAKEISYTKFPGSVEVELNLNLNDKQKKESIRGSYTLPNSFGKSTKVLGIADTAEKQKAADADFFGGEELIKQIEAGKNDFDVVITTPAFMPKLARLGKILGTKGIMPNPKNGTITMDLANTIKKFKAGLKHFKMLESGRINAVIGKTDMDQEKLAANLDAFLKAVLNETKRFGANPIKTMWVAPTMGPKLSVDAAKITLG